DEDGDSADSTITVTVEPGADPVPPVANPDEETTPLDTPVTFDPTENDTPGDTPIVPGETTLLDEDGNPTDEVTIPDVGTFTVEDNGEITFTPEDGFTGTTPPVDYRVFDEDGDSADSTITVTVADPGGPGDPGDPGDPGNPGNPGGPGDPDNPQVPTGDPVAQGPNTGLIAAGLLAVLFGLVGGGVAIRRFRG
uniref:Ig-like domain-containing protein n=1 Tax=Demetria terragena TaxID=63959 RepID=UPI0004778AF7